MSSTRERIQARHGESSWTARTFGMFVFAVLILHLVVWLVFLGVEYSWFELSPQMDTIRSAVGSRVKLTLDAASYDGILHEVDYSMNNGVLNLRVHLTRSKLGEASVVAATLHPWEIDQLQVVEDPEVKQAEQKPN